MPVKLYLHTVFQLQGALQTVSRAGVIIPLAGPQPRALYAGLVWNAGRLWGRDPAR